MDPQVKADDPEFLRFGAYRDIYRLMEELAPIGQSVNLRELSETIATELGTPKDRVKKARRLMVAAGAASVTDHHSRYGQFTRLRPFSSVTDLEYSRVMNDVYPSGHQRQKKTRDEEELVNVAPEPTSRYADIDVLAPAILDQVKDAKLSKYVASTTIQQVVDYIAARVPMNKEMDTSEFKLELTNRFKLKQVVDLGFRLAHVTGMLEYIHKPKVWQKFRRLIPQQVNVLPLVEAIQEGIHMPEEPKERMPLFPAPRTAAQIVPITTSPKPVPAAAAAGINRDSIVIRLANDITELKRQLAEKTEMNEALTVLSEQLRAQLSQVTEDRDYKVLQIEELTQQLEAATQVVEAPVVDDAEAAALAAAGYSLSDFAG